MLEPTTNPPVTKTHLTCEELAIRLRVSVRTIVEWKASGLLPYTKVGSVVRFPVAATDAAMSRFTVHGRAAR